MLVQKPAVAQQTATPEHWSQLGEGRVLADADRELRQHLMALTPGRVLNCANKCLSFAE